jgi:hypothetical protein
MSYAVELWGDYLVAGVWSIRGLRGERHDMT